MQDRKRERRRSKLRKETITVSVMTPARSTDQSPCRPEANEVQSASSVTASLSIADAVVQDVADRKKRSRRVRKTFDTWIRLTLDKGVHGLASEYLKATKRIGSNEVTTFKSNNVNGRNRSAEVGCLDATRVLLKNDPAGNDYINANYVETAQRPRRFIITQAPLDSTIPDFWRMIQGERVDSIIMLCDFVEDNRSKSAVYFPLEKGAREQFENFEITNLELKVIEDVDAKTKVHVSRLKLSSGSGTQTVHHFRWSQWPDRKTPTDVRTALRLLREVRNSKAPIVVHCSTGVGRSGTLVGIEMILEQLIKGENPNTDSMLQDLRRQRAYSISTDVQYVFIHHAVLIYLEGRKPLRGDAKDRAAKFHEEFEKFVRSTAQLK